MARMTTCPNCANHIRVTDSVCPHCGTRHRTVSNPVVPMVLLGLTLVGCPADDGDDSTSSDTTTSDTDGDADTTTETGTTGDTSTDETTTDPGDSEYGVPDTGFETDTTTDSETDAGEAEYGLPDTLDTDTGG